MESLCISCRNDSVLSVTLCRHGDIRLVGGYTDYEGRVQVCSNGYWGRVCGYSWNADSAAMVCRQLFGENKCKAHNSGGSKIIRRGYLK